MLYNNGLYVCESKIIVPFWVVLYLKFPGKTKIWSEIHNKCMIFLQEVLYKSVISTLPLLL